MQYSVAEKPEKHNGGRFFPHVFEFTVRYDRTVEILNELTEQYGPKGERWRFHYSYSYRTRGTNVVLRFIHKDDALNYRLSFNEDEIAPPNMVNFGLHRWATKLKLNSDYGKLEPARFNFKSNETIRFLDDADILLGWHTVKTPSRLEKIQAEGHTIVRDLEAKIKEAFSNGNR